MEIKKIFLFVILGCVLILSAANAAQYYWYYGSASDKSSGIKDCLFLARNFTDIKQCGLFIRANLKNTGGVCFESRQKCLDLSFSKYIYCDKVNGCQATAKGVASLEQCAKENGSKCYEIKNGEQCNRECSWEYYIFNSFDKGCYGVKYRSRKECEGEHKICYLSLNECNNREFKKYSFCVPGGQPKCGVVPGKFTNSKDCELYLAENIKVQTSGKCYESEGTCATECANGKRQFYGWDIISGCIPVGVYPSKEACAKNSKKGCYLTKDDCISKWGTRYYFYNKESAGILGLSVGSCEMTNRGYDFDWQCAQALKKFRKGKTSGSCYEKIEDCQRESQMPRKMYLCVKDVGCQQTNKDYQSFKDCESMIKNGVEASSDRVCYSSGMQCVMECQY